MPSIARRSVSTRTTHTFTSIHPSSPSQPHSLPMIPTSMALLRPSTRCLNLAKSSTCPHSRTQRVTQSISRSTARTLASTHPPDVSEHPAPHDSHFDPPSGWLFGVPPGEKYKKEGWEDLWMYGFWGSLLFGVIVYAYKPDTS